MAAEIRHELADLAGYGLPQFMQVEPLLYWDMLELIRRGLGKIARKSEELVLCERRDPDGFRVLLAACALERAREELADHVSATGAQLVVVHEAATLPWLEPLGLTNNRPCIQTVYDNHGQDTFSRGHAFAWLDRTAADFIAAVYDSIGDPDYVLDRLDQQRILGIYVDPASGDPGQPDGPHRADGLALAGFIGQHSEGAVGMQEVLPRYRRQGLGLALMEASCLAGHRRGERPYAQVYTDNAASLELQRKAGMNFAPGHIYWTHTRPGEDA